MEIKHLKPKFLGNINGFTGRSFAGAVWDKTKACPTLNSMQGGGRQPSVVEIKKIVYDDYNSAIRADQRTMTTLTTNCGATALRNGVKIIEVDNLNMAHSAAMRGRYDEPGKTSQHLEVRADEVCNNLTTVQKDSLVLETHVGIEEIPEIFHKFIYEIDGELYLIRIRKLTPLECWRLMGFSDEDYNKAESVVSNTQLYKQAGNSIVKQVLMAVFSQMVKPQDSKTVLKKKTLALLDLL